MSYLNVNPLRLRYLLSAGTEAGEIATFFKNHRAQLIASGTSLFKVSDRKDARVEFLSRLNGKAAGVFASWIRKRLAIEQSVLPEELVARFGEIERTSERHDRKTEHVHARLGLYYLYQADPPQVWLDFLRTPIDANDSVESAVNSEVDVGHKGAKPVQGQVQSEHTRNPHDSRRLWGPPTASDILEIANLIEGGGTAKISDRSGESVWPVVIGAVAQLWREPESDVRALQLDGLDENLKMAVIEALSPIRNRWLARIQGSGGFDCRNPSSISALERVDGDGAHVLGRCVGETHAGSAAFVDPYGLLVGDELYALDRAEARKIFPDTGQLIGFPGSAYPSVGEFGVWIAERYQSNQAIKLRIRARGEAAYQIDNLPVPSSEPDAIRDAVRANPNSGSADFVFRLSDGVLIKAQGEDRNLMRHDFSVPLRAWKRLRGWHVGGIDVVLGPLPPPDMLLDCSDLASVLKSLLEDERAVEDWPQLTHANVRTMVDYVREQESLLSEKRLRRLENELHAFVETRERLEEVVSIVLQSEKVQAGVEVAKQAIVRNYEESRRDLLRSRQALEDEIKQLKAARSRLVDEKRKAVAEVSSAIDKAFEKAKANGLETLGDVALFEALLDSRTVGDRTQESSEFDRSAGVTVHIVPKLEATLEDALNRCGFRTPDARSLGQIVAGAYDVGLSVGIVGAGSGFIARQVAAALCKTQCAVIEIGVGLCDSREVNRTLDGFAPEIDVVLIRGANCSDFSAYGPSIEREVLGRLSSGGEQKARLILFAFESGPSALPIPSVLQEACLIADLGWVDEARNAESPTTESIRERLESSHSSGLGKLKSRAVHKLLVACEASERIGDFWKDLLNRNVGASAPNHQDDEGLEESISSTKRTHAHLRRD